RDARETVQRRAWQGGRAGRPEKIASPAGWPPGHAACLNNRPRPIWRSNPDCRMIAFMKMMRGSASFLFTVGTVGAAMAAQPTGQAVAVVPSAAASGTGGARTLVVNGDVFTGDVIRTTDRGSAQVKFVDDTRLVVGPNSQVEIDSFVFQSA